MSDPKITLTFTEESKYRLDFTPPRFWKAFTTTYDGLPWAQRDDQAMIIVAENYSYLLDLLVQARLYYIGVTSAGVQCG